jgi:hypothetical protein
VCLFCGFLKISLTSFEIGHKKDVENYKEAFKVLGFKEHEINVYEDKTIKEMKVMVFIV